MRLPTEADQRPEKTAWYVRNPGMLAGRRKSLVAPKRLPSSLKWLHPQLASSKRQSLKNEFWLFSPPQPHPFLPFHSPHAYLAQAHIIFTWLPPLVTGLPAFSWTDLSRGLLRIPHWPPISFQSTNWSMNIYHGAALCQDLAKHKESNSEPERHIPAPAALTGESDKWTVTILSVTGGRGRFLSQIGHQERLWESRYLGWDIKDE